MIDREHRGKLLLAAGFALLALIWSGLLGQSHLTGRATPLDLIEATLLDLRFLYASDRRPAPPNVAIVAIDDDTVRDVGRYPLPRSTMAELVARLASLGAKTVALDVLFIDAGPPDQDQALAKALGEAKTVIAAAGIFDDHSDAAAIRSHQFPYADQIVWPVDSLRTAAFVGTVNLSSDSRGTPRHVPLIIESRDGPILSFPLRAATRVLAEGVTIAPDRDRIAIGPIETRTDLNFTLPLRFYGPRATITTVSAGSVLKGEVGRELIDGRIVLIGATALGSRDTFETPYDSALPGVEVLATAVSHLTNGDGLVRDRWVRLIDGSAAVLLSLTAALLIAVVPLGPALIATASAGASWLALTALAFTYHYWLSAIVPLAALSGSGALCAAVRYTLDRRQTRRLADAERALRRFQAPALADRIARDPTFLASPIQQEVPVLFVDLSNFTRVSERLGPQRTRDLLREYHGILEHEVTRNGGVVLSFMGDGAMIVFGLPDPKADDASRAIRAAVGIVGSVREWLASLSRRWPDDRTEDLDVRVGAHYGPVVISRLGTDTYQHITATGDSVNVTSRLLAVAAQQRAPVIVSLELLLAAGRGEDFGAFGDLQEIAIRGRERPLTVASWPRKDQQMQGA